MNIKRYKIRHNYIIIGNQRILKGEVKPDGCIYPDMHRCKGCELNHFPELINGGCMLDNAAYYGIETYD